LDTLRNDYDHYRRAILCEPRGSDVLVGAFLVEPVDPTCAAAVIFFNNAGYLGMCGHGIIGVTTTLAFMERIKPGNHRIETPVGIVEVQLHPDGRVTVQNVPAYRHRANVRIAVPGYGYVIGDVAWGGNWFFLVKEHSFHQAKELLVENVEALTSFTWEIRGALGGAGITGANGAEIDHVELFSKAHEPGNQGRNFMLCPGKAYDRSPCGTGSSAKIACLAADNLLAPGELWRQEGILDTVFECSYRMHEGQIVPIITGSAHVTAQATLIFDPADPFRLGVPA
jgi:4-hydroxyproline epimerase